MIDIEILDLNFQDTEEVIASFLLLGSNSVSIVETGPTTCLESLLSGIERHGPSPENIDQVFLTHIHLDHAGASGHLAEILPNATFYVHEVGYPHLVNPEKLVKSATRIYGDRMEELWGEARPVPEDRIVVLEGTGEEIKTAGGLLEAHYTPGHAYHHLAFHEPDSGTLFAGDVAGIRLPGQSYVRPPTPPPEIDVDAWKESLQLMRKIAPQSVCPTHFGRYEDVGRHLNELEQRLQDWLLFIEERADDSTPEEITQELTVRGDAELLSEGAQLEESDRYQLAGNYEMLVTGLLKYVEKQRQA